MARGAGRRLSVMGAARRTGNGGSQASTASAAEAGGGVSAGGAAAAAAGALPAQVGLAPAPHALLLAASPPPPASAVAPTRLAAPLLPLDVAAAAAASAAAPRGGGGRRMSLALPRRVASKTATALGAFAPDPASDIWPAPVDEGPAEGLAEGLAEAPRGAGRQVLPGGRRLGGGRAFVASVTRTLFENDDQDDGSGEAAAAAEALATDARCAEASAARFEPVAAVAANGAVTSSSAAAVAAAPSRSAHLSAFFQVARGLATATARAGGPGRSGLGGGADATCSSDGGGGGSGSSSGGGAVHWQERLRAAKSLPDALLLYGAAGPSALSGAEQAWCRAAADALLGDLHQKVRVGGGGWVIGRLEALRRLPA
jgi:hypothetical protein